MGHLEDIGLHSHTRPNVGTIEWYFHSDNHDQIRHCEGSVSNHYVIVHKGKLHVINKKYARGHGIKGEPQWFKFTEKLSNGMYNLKSGIKIITEGVPDAYKE